MKKLMMVIISILFLTAGFGCATVPEKPKEVCVCPAETVVIPVHSPYGTLFVPIPKSSLDDPENYLTEEQFNKLLKEYREKEQLKRSIKSY